MPAKEPSRRKRKSPTVSAVADALAGGAPPQQPRSVEPASAPLASGEQPRSRDGGPLAAAPLAVDFPAEGELVYPGHYAVRIHALDASAVDVSADGGPWSPCREALGYHWHDWNPLEPGSHEIVARVKIGGRWKKSKTRACIVSAP
ncbi:MAG: hypothetical protein AAB578_02890 [Elusimicrobiota bacterium]